MLVTYGRYRGGTNKHFIHVGLLPGIEVSSLSLGVIFEEEVGELERSNHSRPISTFRLGPICQPPCGEDGLNSYTGPSEQGHMPIFVHSFIHS